MRVRKSQKEWIKNNAGSYSPAGKLDEIINYYKKHTKLEQEE